MKRVLRFIVYSLPYIFVFIASFYLPKDPDLGWHLKYGEYFFQHGQILRENIYSTIMTGYNWPNGSWATDIITYAIYHTGGFLGLIIASALIVTATFFFFAKAARLSLLETAIFFPLLTYLEYPLNNHSFRGHQISMLLLGVLVFILSRYKPSSKILWFVPVLFFLWVNLQIESFLGVAVFGLWVSFTILQSLLKLKIFSKEHKFLLKVFFVSVFVTFLNPFGWGIHMIAYAHATDPLLKKVNDYVPFPVWTRAWWNQIVVLIVLIGGGMYLFFKKKLRENIVWLGIPLLLLLLSFNVRRYLWPAYYMMLPLLHILWQPLEKYTKKYGFFIAYVLSLVSIAYVGYLKMPFSQFATMSWETYCAIQSVPCSQKSAKFLQEYKFTGKLFTYYDWGGFLIWNYPTVKPSIDGRMHVWRDEKGYSGAEEYDMYLSGQKKIDESSYNVVYIPMDRSMPLYQEINELVLQEKWKAVYDDGSAGIVIRIKQ